VSTGGYFTPVCSVGECFDKISRLVGIASIPGGPHLERMADEGEALIAREAARAEAEAASGGASEEACRRAGAKAGAALAAKYEVTMPMQVGTEQASVAIA
jgi:tRNA A37 threonylcarbamoyltransferase TsaD